MGDFYFIYYDVYTYIYLYVNIITNEEVFEKIGERRTWWNSLRKRRGQMKGHTRGHGGLLRDVLEEGRWIKGESNVRLEYLDQIIRDMVCETFREVKQLACDRAEWRRVVGSNQS